MSQVLEELYQLFCQCGTSRFVNRQKLHHLIQRSAEAEDNLLNALGREHQDLMDALFAARCDTAEVWDKARCLGALFLGMELGRLEWQGKADCPSRLQTGSQ